MLFHDFSFLLNVHLHPQYIVVLAQNIISFTSELVLINLVVCCSGPDLQIGSIVEMIWCLHSSLIKLNLLLERPLD